MITVPHGDVPKGVRPGDIVRFEGSQYARMVVYVGRHSISFVRLRSSRHWKRHHRNATAFHSLPKRLWLLRRATAETSALARRFENWLREPVSDRDWQRVCALQVDAIKCECDQ